VVAAAAAPFAGGEPELVVEEPLAGPGQDRLGDWVAGGPLAGLMQAQAAVVIDVGQVSVGIDGEPRATHEDARKPPRRASQIYEVETADLAGLDFAGPSQYSGLQRRLSLRVVLAEKSGLANEGEDASIGHGSGGAESWCRCLGSLFPAGRR